MSKPNKLKTAIKELEIKLNAITINDVRKDIARKGYINGLTEALEDLRRIDEGVKE